MGDGRGSADSRPRSHPHVDRSATRGDPVRKIAAATGLPGVVVAPVLRTRAFTRDSVGLSAGERQHNIAGRVVLRSQIGGDVVLVDDIATTGATASESVRVLHRAGARVMAVVVIANA